jgi:hypothetical protein
LRSGDIGDHDPHHGCSVTIHHREPPANTAGADYDHNPRRLHDHNVTGADDINSTWGTDNNRSRGADNDIPIG